MHQFIVRICFVVLASCMAATTQAADAGTPDEAVAMVKKTIAYLKANGIDKTVAEVNRPKGQFTDRDMYVTIVDLSGKSLAHGANPKMVGKDLSEMRDADGNYITRQRNEVLKAHEDGWIKYRWLNPVTQKIEPKSLYFAKVDAYVISCGVYTR